ncbi:glycosyltransferase family 4 protein [Paenibacillus rhizovicinus]|uniref:Glycosyltransferase family 4 protein n=1 Tax=Paenibacillus rhizovicinus TaxID=2704463 RepID=A0A6C0NXD2_9BACL|nr:glycosyltransferase family 4 protein [Paenibacillus rhizovicinus]QHW30859.1 glycosyltransferase family 4 protein [Paenibacillus rhizovicinus]
MRVLHLLASGDIGGIEVLCKDIGLTSKHENIFCFLWRGGQIEEEMKMCGLNTIVINLEKKFSLAPLKMINKAIHEYSVEAIIFHHSSPLLWIYLPILKKQNRNIKVLLYSHNHFDNLVLKGNRKYWMYRLLFKRAYKNADQIVAISECVKKSIKEGLKYSDNKIVVIHNGINNARFECVREEKKQNCEIVYVGRIIKEKGLHVLINAIVYLKGLSNFHVSIVGSGPYMDEIAELVRSHELEGVVSIAGPTRNVSEVFRNSDIFVHPAIWEEGFGITIVEALSSGLVCVVSNKGATKEIIDNEENGYIFKSGDSQQLSEILEYLIINKDSKEMEIIRQNAITKAETFSLDKMVGKLDQLLSY